VPRPQRAQSRVVGRRLAVALYLNHRGGLVGRNQRQPRQPQGEFILRELDLLPRLDNRAESAFGFSPAKATTTSGL
jgi:hypothetical protein